MPVVRRSRIGRTVAPEAAHAAVRVANARAEEEVQRAAQQGVADVAVDPVHRAGLDVVHPVAHHELCAVTQLLDEARDLVEWIRHVGVEHHDVLAARRREAGEVGRAVAAPRLVHDARAGGGRKLRAAVLGIVVGDDDLAADAGLGERVERAPHALLDVLGLVQAWDDDRHLDRPGVQRARRARSCAVDRGHWRVLAGPGRALPDVITAREKVARLRRRGPSAARACQARSPADPAVCHAALATCASDRL